MGLGLRALRAIGALRVEGFKGSKGKDESRVGVEGAHVMNRMSVQGLGVYGFRGRCSVLMIFKTLRSPGHKKRLDPTLHYIAALLTMSRGVNPNPKP